MFIIIIKAMILFIIIFWIFLENNQTYVFGCPFYVGLSICIAWTWHILYVCLLGVLSGINVVIFDKWLSKQASQLHFLYSDDVHNDNMFDKSIWKNLKFLEAMCLHLFHLNPPNLDNLRNRKSYYRFECVQSNLITTWFIYFGYYTNEKNGIVIYSFTHVSLGQHQILQKIIWVWNICHKFFLV